MGSPGCLGVGAVGSPRLPGGEGVRGHLGSPGGEGQWGHPSCLGVRGSGVTCVKAEGWDVWGPASDSQWCPEGRDPETSVLEALGGESDLTSPGALGGGVSGGGLPSFLLPEAHPGSSPSH